MTDYIKKLRAGRVANANVATWVGESGTIFYNESNGQLKIADGTTPGGHFIGIPVATSTQAGGIKAGPGANVGVDGTLTINTAGIPLSFGDFAATIDAANNASVLSTVNPNEDMTLVTNGSANVNIVGNLHVHVTSLGGQSAEPIFRVNGDGQVRMLVPAADSIQGAVEIIGSLNGTYQIPVNTGVMLHITGNPPDSITGNAIVSRVYNDSQATYALYTGRRYNGTALVPTQVLAGQDIVRYAGTGYTSSGWTSLGPGRIAITATENQTGTAQGANVSIWATPNGVTSAAGVTKVATFDATVGLSVTGNVTATNLTGTLLTASQTNITQVGTLGSLAVSGNVNANGGNIGYITLYNNSIYSTLTNVDITIGQTAATANIVLNRSTSVTKDLYANGNVYIAANKTITTPRIVINDGGMRSVSGGTTLTIDFSVDSRILWYVPSGDTTITLANYTAGAEVLVMVRMGANGRNIALGIAGVNNSTTASTSLVGHGAGSNYGANQAVALVYTCYDNTQANCYVRASYI